MVKRLSTMQETQVPSLGREGPLEKEIATHSSTLAWKIPWTEEPGRLQSMRSLRVGRLHFHFSLSCLGEGNGNPLQCSCLENPRDGGAWWAAVYGVAQSWTRLKRLSSSNNRPQLCCLWKVLCLRSWLGESQNVNGSGRECFRCMNTLGTWWPGLLTLFSLPSKFMNFLSLDRGPSLALFLPFFLSSEKKERWWKEEKEEKEKQIKKKWQSEGVGPRERGIVFSEASSRTRRRW